MQYRMKDPNLVSEIKKTIDSAQGMQASEVLQTTTFIVVDKGKILFRTATTYLVKFASKQNAVDFVDSLTPILPGSSSMDVSTRDDGTALVTFDP